VKESQNPEYTGKELEAMSFAVNYHQWIVDELTPYLGETVVEVGAGTGDMSRLLLQTRLKHLYSFEPSSNMFPKLKAKAEGVSRMTAFNEYFNERSVVDAPDSVLYLNVLEHIEDDAAELLNVYKALRSGAYLLIFVPALSWLFSPADESVGHYRRYHKVPLVKRVEEAGFKVEKARYFDLAGIIPWYVNFVLLKNSFSAGSITLYDRLVVPPMRYLERAITPPIGKNILLIARKP